MNIVIRNAQSHSSCFRLFLAFLFLCIYLSGFSQNKYFPISGSPWVEKNPASIKLNASTVKAAVDFALANEYSGERDLRLAILRSFSHEPFHTIAGPTRERGGPAGMIIKDGYIVAKWGDLDRVDMTFSVTKSYLSTVAGLAHDDKLIGNLNAPVKQYVWDGTFDGNHNSKITWSHLLTQSSDWSGTLFGMQDWADRPPREGGIDEWKNRALKEPGTNFEYNDVRVNLLAYALLQVWRKPLPLILKERIMDPIGASTTWRWYGYEDSFINIDGTMMQSVSGGGHSGGGMFINTWDQAKFGLLFLRNGNWAGKQILSNAWVAEIQKPSAASAAYGYMWWLNGGTRKWEGVSDSVYYASGFGGNFIVVDEEHDLLIITRWLEPSKLGEMVRLVTSALQ